DLVRDVAPPMVLNQIDSSRQARFELDSGQNRYAIDVYPQRGFWQVMIEIAAEAPIPEQVAYSESRRNFAPRTPQMTPPSAVPVAPLPNTPSGRHPTPSSAVPTAMPHSPSGRHALPRDRSNA